MQGGWRYKAFTEIARIADILSSAFPVLERHPRTTHCRFCLSHDSLDSACPIRDERRKGRNPGRLFAALTPPASARQKSAAGTSIATKTRPFSSTVLFSWNHCSFSQSHPKLGARGQLGSRVVAHHDKPQPGLERRRIAAASRPKRQCQHAPDGTLLHRDQRRCTDDFNDSIAGRLRLRL